MVNPDLIEGKPLSPIPYSLSAEDMKAPFEGDLEEYVEGGRVTRNNLTRFLIQSFAVSRGMYQSHELYFRWKEATDGFDYKTMLKNLGQLGGIRSVLNEIEIEQIAAAVRRVSAHARFKGPDGSSNDIRNYQARNIANLFNGQLAEFNKLKVYPVPIGPEDHLQTTSFRELQTAINDWLPTAGQTYTPEYVIR